MRRRSPSRRGAAARPPRAPARRSPEPSRARRRRASAPSRSRRRLGRCGRERRADDVELRLGEDRDVVGAAEALGAKADLRDGLLPGHEQRAAARAATAPRALSSSVDLPTPGSPPRSTSEAGTSPPPRTRSSSETPSGAGPPPRRRPGAASPSGPSPSWSAAYPDPRRPGSHSRRLAAGLRRPLGDAAVRARPLRQPLLPPGVAAGRAGRAVGDPAGESSTARGSPAEAWEAWRRGDVLAAPPILHTLEVLSQDGPLRGLDRLRDPAETNLGPFRRVEMRPGRGDVPAPHPHAAAGGRPPTPTCWGRGDAVLVDPGASARRRELDRLEPPSPPPASGSAAGSPPSGSPTTIRTTSAASSACGLLSACPFSPTP